MISGYLLHVIDLLSTIFEYTYSLYLQQVSVCMFSCSVEFESLSKSSVYVF